MTQVAQHVAQLPDQQAKTDFAQRSITISQAAESVLSQPAGPQRTQAWNAQLDSLQQSGIIDQGTHDKWYNNPSDLALGQAMALGHTVQQLMRSA